MTQVSIDRFAAIAVQRGFLSRHQLEAAIREIGLEAARDRQKLITALVRRNDLTTAQVDQILRILRGRDLWCPACKCVQALDRFDPQRDYPCSRCGTTLRRVDRLDAQSNLRIDDVFDEIEEETGTVRLSRWKFIRRLGRGGMGKVYLARHRKLRKLAAIKVLPSDLSANPAFVSLFMREGRALAKLKHPNIVEVYDIDNESGVYFLVMEYVDGCSLQELLDQSGIVSPRVAIRIAQEICAALQHAHDAGFVHRDIKPSNILLGRTGSVKLTDFGLVREGSPDSTGWVDAIFGTPNYMSPEQARGKPGDARSDIYSLGSTLYAMLAGTPPYADEDTMNLLIKLCTDDPPSLQHLAPGVPPSLHALVTRMMAKSPPDRPATIAVVRGELERCAQECSKAAT